MQSSKILPTAARLVEQPLNASSESTLRPVRAREYASLALLVIVADTTLYWGQGYFGLCAFFLISPLALGLGLARVRVRECWPLLVLLALTVSRVAWLGSPLRVACAAVIWIALLVRLHGGPVLMSGCLTLPAQTFTAGWAAVRTYLQRLGVIFHWVPRGMLLSIGVPLVVITAFASLFILANPDVVRMLDRYLEIGIERIGAWISAHLVNPSELVFLLAATIIAAGLLRPVIAPSRFRRTDDWHRENDVVTAKSPHIALYLPFRNTLLAVNALFIVYLVFEFTTLWFREFPDGFYYAGYAHEGACWLTVSLALATLVLSFIFRGAVFHDRRLPVLRRLAWVWCVLNGLLAIAVYNRLFIYVRFNGLTHMRIIGLFGITAVVAGFALVVFKIRWRRNFTWLVSRQLWALGVIILIYALVPIDAWAASYNVRRIHRGDVSACVQIGIHPLDVEGVLALTPLINHPEPVIREGVRARLAATYKEVARRQDRRQVLGWTAWQFSDARTLNKLEPWRDSWQDYTNDARRAAALLRFQDYAYRWY